MPDPAVAALQPFTHSVEDISLALLESQHITWPEYQADLLRVDALGGFIEKEHLQDDQAEAFHLFNFWPVLGVENILERQIMDAEVSAERIDDADVVDAAQVDPADGFCLFDGDSVFNGDVCARLERLLAIVNQTDDRLVDFLLADMNQ